MGENHHGPDIEERLALERHRMVEKQIQGRGIVDARVLKAMKHVPRHRFVPATCLSHAYDDKPLPIGHGQTISQPYMVALMTSLLALQDQDRVLEIGTGSGYQTAILAELAGTVFSVERVPELADSARGLLESLGYQNVHVFCGDGTKGLPEYAPYDAIIVTAGSPHIPEALRAQLADGGRLVCPVGNRELQYLVRIIRSGDHFHEEKGIGCVFVPLLGENGWKD